MPKNLAENEPATQHFDAPFKQCLLHLGGLVLKVDMTSLQPTRHANIYMAYSSAYSPL